MFLDGWEDKKFVLVSQGRKKFGAPVSEESSVISVSGSSLDCETVRGAKGA
jgi:hypothetical protein